VIIIPQDSFLLIEKREESLGALRYLREHLVPGGRPTWLYLQTKSTVSERPCGWVVHILSQAHVATS